MTVDIEDDIMDPVMQCTTLPSHLSISQKKLVSFVTEIHTLSIDISLRDYAPVTRMASTAVKPCQEDSYEFYLITGNSNVDVAIMYQRSRIHYRILILKLSKAQVDQESQIKMIQVKEMMQDKDLKNSKSKDKGSRSRSQSMNEQSHYKQEKIKTRPNKAKLKPHIFNIGEDKVKTRQPPTRMLSTVQECQHRRLTPSLKEDLNIGGV
ncbi:hypothetical protein Tco_0658910 [Tanacetum coccineum]